MPNALAAVRWRPISHEEHLSVLGHLDELRTRLIISLLTLAVAFGICFWQHTKVLRLIDRPLAHQTQQQVRAGHGPLAATHKVQRSARDIARQLDTVVGAIGAQSRQPALPRHWHRSATHSSVTCRSCRRRRPGTGRW